MQFDFPRFYWEVGVAQAPCKLVLSSVIRYIHFLLVSKVRMRTTLWVTSCIPAKPGRSNPRPLFLSSVDAVFAWQIISAIEYFEIFLTFLLSNLTYILLLGIMHSIFIRFILNEATIRTKNLRVCLCVCGGGRLGGCGVGTLNFQVLKVEFENSLFKITFSLCELHTHM